MYLFYKVGVKPWGKWDRLEMNSVTPFAYFKDKKRCHFFQANYTQGKLFLAFHTEPAVSSHLHVICNGAKYLYKLLQLEAATV